MPLKIIILGLGRNEPLQIAVISVGTRHAMLPLPPLEPYVLTAHNRYSSVLRVGFFLSILFCPVACCVLESVLCTVTLSRGN